MAPSKIGLLRPEAAGHPLSTSLRAGQSSTTRAGFPATIENAGTFFVTTDAFATMVPSPIATPFKIVAPVPIHTASPMVIGDDSDSSQPLPNPWVTWATRRDANAVAYFYDLTANRVSIVVRDCCT